VHVAGFVVRELSSICSSWRAAKELSDYLASEGVTGIEDVDTRFLTRKLRTVGVMNGVVSTEKTPDEDLVQMAREAPRMEGQDLVQDVTSPGGYPWNRGRVRDYVNDPTLANQDGPLVVAIDFGIKRNILRNLCDRGFRVEVVPAKLSADEILAMKPDGVFLSNGPGDPEPVRYGIRTVRKLLGQVPVFGICLGHQILGLALGGRTYKLRFGHHGANHPVRNLATNQVEITSQNHGFCVDIDSLAGKGVDVTHMNLNDDTLEGIRCREKRCFSVQYHPEASPGPHDSAYLFDEFRKVVDEGF
jgi:carbamoyl-phosphate synthase small subunit